MSEPRPAGPLGAARRYLTRLLGSMRWRMARVVALMIGAGLAEGLGLLLLVPLLAAAGLDIQEGAIGSLARIVSSTFAMVGIQPTLAVVLLLFVMFTVVRAGLTHWQTLESTALEQEFVLDLRQRLYTTIFNSSWLSLSKARASDLSHALTSEIDRVGAATSQLLSLLAGACVAAAYLVLAFQLSAVMTMAVFVGGALLVGGLHGLTRRSHRLGGAISEAMGSFYAAAIEHPPAAKTIKSHGAESQSARLFSSLARGVAEARLSGVRVYALSKFCFDVGSVIVLGVLLFVAVQLLRLPTAGLLLLLFLFARLIPRLASLQQQAQGVLSLLPAFESIEKLQAHCEAAAEQTVWASSKSIDFSRSLRLERATFRYDERSSFAVRELDLQIAHGTTCAIVGPSGAGKTTVADMLMGLLVPQSGRMVVDGRPVDVAQLGQWRRQVGYVAQDTFLFHDTVRSNLLWAHPDATEDEIGEALRLAAADEFVWRLPDRLETVLGDRGIRLSGGERQRLALARALLRKPAVVVLDEATSALDSENEQRILSAIDRLRGTLTIVMIAHRLSTVRGADLIYVIEEGRLVESGAWDTLVQLPSGRFRAMAEVQGLVQPVGATMKGAVVAVGTDRETG